MIVKIGNQNAVKISDEVVCDVLNVYKEEELIRRPIFKKAFENGFISYGELLKECNRILIPWQMFFLTHKNLIIETKEIERKRDYKFSKKFFTKRKGSGSVTSKRIIDRLIRLQNYITKNNTLPNNEFCNSLKNQKIDNSINILFDFFNISAQKLQTIPTKERALNYLISKIELKNINISRGVLKGGILPEIKSARSVYKNTSGFALGDSQIPFIFLPDEINPDDVAGRRIYTLIYLLTCIGLGDYDFYIETSFTAAVLESSGLEETKHTIVSEFLLPKKDTLELDNIKITKDIISDLSSRYKITPTAVATILRKRRIIKTYKEYKALLPEKFIPRKNNSGPRNPAKISTSVKKFCGNVASKFVNQGIKNKTLKSSQAQYLIFGRVQKKKYKEYCQQTNT